MKKTQQFICDYADEKGCAGPTKCGLAKPHTHKEGLPEWNFNCPMGGAVRISSDGKGRKTYRRFICVPVE